jgi:hypothetical protein
MWKPDFFTTLDWYDEKWLLSVNGTLSSFKLNYYQSSIPPLKPQIPTNSQHWIICSQGNNTISYLLLRSFFPLLTTSWYFESHSQVPNGETPRLWIGRSVFCGTKPCSCVRVCNSRYNRLVNDLISREMMDEFEGNPSSSSSFLNTLALDLNPRLPRQSKAHCPIWRPWRC